MSSQFFHQLDLTSIKHSIVLLDIDGTLTSDGQDALAPEVLASIRLLQKNNRVYLCSNKSDRERNRRVAHQTGVPYLDTPLKKPNPRIVTLIPEPRGLPLVMIGDKWLTDGRFAKRVGAQFIKVRRLVSGHEGRYVQFTHWVDDWFGWLLIN